MTNYLDEIKQTLESPEYHGGGYIYDNGTTSDLEISIRIEEIGGKVCCGGCDKYDLPIPNYLNREFKRFIDKYKIPIIIWIRNPDWDSECEK